MKWFFFSNVTVATGGVSSGWAGLGWAGLVLVGSTGVDQRAAPDTWDKPEGEGGSLSLKGLAMLPIVSLTAKPQGRKNHRAIVTREPHPQHGDYFMQPGGVLSNTRSLCLRHNVRHAANCISNDVANAKINFTEYVLLAGWSCVLAWQLACNYAKLRVCLRSPATLHILRTIQSSSTSWLCRRRIMLAETQSQTQEGDGGYCATWYTRNQAAATMKQ